MTSGTDVPSRVVGGMIFVPDDNFIARTEFQSVDDCIIALTGISGDSDFVWIGPNVFG